MNYLLVAFLYSKGFLMALATVLVFSCHPLLLMVVLVIESLTVSVISGLMGLNIWCSYVLVLVFMGGMLVVFLYLTSLTPKGKYDIKIGVLSTLVSLFILFLVFFNYMYPLDKVFLESAQGSFLLSLLSSVSISVYLYLGGILLLALVYSSSMCSSSQGALRAK